MNYLTRVLHENAHASYPDLVAAVRDLANDVQRQLGDAVTALTASTREEEFINAVFPDAAAYTGNSTTGDVISYRPPRLHKTRVRALAPYLPPPPLKFHL